ncbi:stanniocalcin-like [Branchiostoma lanceolatum]|uniref:stanniocalcin-like n=1 Tax=Branchiostoma lanceolatum TaxID=7740 RepID=UPI003453EA9B
MQFVSWMLVVSLLVSRDVRAYLVDRVSPRLPHRRTDPEISPIQQCLHSEAEAENVCDVFLCLELDDTCLIQGLYDLCLNFFRNTNNFSESGQEWIEGSFSCIAATLQQIVGPDLEDCDRLGSLVLTIEEECFSNYGICKMVRYNAGPLEATLASADLTQKTGEQLVQTAMQCGRTVRFIVHRILRDILGGNPALFSSHDLRLLSLMRGLGK